MPFSEYTHLYPQILQRIHSAQHVILVMHRKPDGDTAGAALAIAHYLETQNKPHTCFCVDVLPPSLRFLPGAHTVTSALSHWRAESVAFDLIIVLDTGDLAYAGIHEHVAALPQSIPIINIDHHKTNTQFGHHNLVIPEASSTCEIVHDLLSSAAALNHTIATCLLTGLVTDTGGFMNLATTASALTAAANLLSHGVTVHTMSKKTLRNRDAATLLLWGRALERLYITNLGMAMTMLTPDDFRDCNATSDAVEGLSNFLNICDQAQDVRGTGILAEVEPGRIKGSLRTTNPLMDVSKIATLFGGGGHVKAAGFEIRGHIRNINDDWIIEPL